MMKASGMVRVLSDKYTEREKKSVRGDSFFQVLPRLISFVAEKSEKIKKKKFFHNRTM
jgi:hypothetical protein